MANRGLPARRTSRTEAPKELVARRAMAPSALPEAVSGSCRIPGIGGVPCVCCEPDRPQTTCVWFHGGGFRGSGVSLEFGTLRGGVGIRGVMPGSSWWFPRWPPSIRFPPRCTDATAVYDGVTDQWGPVFVGGDSAGGGLAVFRLLNRRISLY